MATRKEVRIYPLTNWQQAVADGSTKLGYRAWVKANVGKIERVGETAHDRLVATKRP